jgi:AcrR family transcriptional regulator
VPAVPTTPKGKRTWAHILASARRVFARTGYVAATMSAIAEESGTSLGGLYRYFTNKEDVFESLIGNIHEELYRVSGTTTHNFHDAPYDALFEANLGYLRHYYEHRDVMRVLVEAATVEDRFRDFWWKMRARHINRFTQALHTQHGMDKVDGLPAHLMTEAAACMVEQSAYFWFAHEEQHDEAVSVEEAAQVVTRAWHNMFFGG